LATSLNETVALGMVLRHGHPQLSERLFNRIHHHGWPADEILVGRVGRRQVPFEHFRAATMRSPADWSLHPQGKLVASEPLVWLERTEKSAPCVDARDRTRPLAGARVLEARSRRDFWPDSALKCCG
jgi:hypothetical protein